MHCRTFPCDMRKDFACLFFSLFADSSPKQLQQLPRNLRWKQTGKLFPGREPPFSKEKKQWSERASNGRNHNLNSKVKSVLFSKDVEPEIGIGIGIESSSNQTKSCRVRGRKYPDHCFSGTKKGKILSSSWRRLCAIIISAGKRGQRRKAMVGQPANRSCSFHPEVLLWTATSFLQMVGRWEVKNEERRKEGKEGVRVVRNEPEPGKEEERFRYLR